MQSPLIAWLAAIALMISPEPGAADEPALQYDTREIRGWTVHVDSRLRAEHADKTARALGILDAQLARVIADVPGPAVQQLRQVKLWLSLPYPNVRPTAEYHPGEQWLRDHGRNPAMVRGVEFTNVLIFEQEWRRMPVFVLHELAHAYHHRVLSYRQRDLLHAYESARRSHLYEAVQRHPAKVERAYALANVQEYFAETSEAFFGENDYFPFNRHELEQHDPEMAQVLAQVWGVDDLPADGAVAVAHAQFAVRTPPAHFNRHGFYAKCLEANGYPILASAKVNDDALREAGFLVQQMLAHRPDVRRAMIAGGSRLIVMAHNEFTTDVPEHSRLEPKDYWDARARGLGGSQTDPVCSVGEENLLAFPGDPYAQESILIHEFAHNIHLRGMVVIDPTFDARVETAWKNAIAAGLWKGKYAATNHHEYFAEGVQSWFDNNREHDHDHNHVNTRAELIEYDPELAELCAEVFGETRLSYTKPQTRLYDHLRGYNPATAPTFVWPARLSAARQAIQAAAQSRPQSAAPPASEPAP